MEIMVVELGDGGATHKELKQAFVEAKAGSESTFNREWKKLKAGDQLRQEEYDGKTIFFARAPEKYKTASPEEMAELRELFAEKRLQKSTD